ncbi:MAG: hypothetical protein AMXMBFR67_35810 [Nitrospira sp.]
MGGGTPQDTSREVQVTIDLIAKHWFNIKDLPVWRRRDKGGNGCLQASAQTKLPIRSCALSNNISFTFV